MFGTEEQKQRFLPRCAAGRHHRVPAHRARRRLRPGPAGLDGDASPRTATYLLDGVKLWTTNGVDRRAARRDGAGARARDGSRGGITAFVVEADSPGITVENRNAFMGLRASRTASPASTRCACRPRTGSAARAQGLKIALTTLNTGRLSIPAMCAAAGKWCLKIAREWSAERVQWGQPGRRSTRRSPSKISFIAATTFALEAVLDLSAQLADAGTKDIRIEAALAKLWSSEMAWLIADELVQIRGGRGYETADSLAARGERAVPAEQVLRDLRINRIFEGSTEIMHLLIAREAVDAHLSAAGDLVDRRRRHCRTRRRPRPRPAASTPSGCRKLVAGKGTRADVVRRVRPARQAPALRRAVVAQARPPDLLRHVPLAGQARAPAGLPRPDRRHRRRAVRDGGGLLAGRDAARPTTPRARATAAYELADAFCAQARLRVEELFDRLWNNTDDVDRELAERILDGAYTWLEEGVLDPSEGTGPWIAAWEPGESTAPTSPATTADSWDQAWMTPIRWPSGSVNCPITRPSITLSGPNTRLPPRSRPAKASPRGRAPPHRR